MIRAIKLIILLLLGTLILCGCSFRTVDEMYRLPERSEAYQNLQTSIDAAMSGMEYCAPLAGEQRQTVQMADLDGDKEDEYLLFAKGDFELPLRILIFDKVDGEFLHMETVQSSGSAFDLIEYAQMDANPGMELVVGHQLNDNVIRSLSVYTFCGGQAQQLVSTSYSKYLTANLDDDPFAELVVMHPGSAESDNGVAELYGIVDGNMERSVEASMSAPVDRIKRILVGKLQNEQNAVYVASAIGDLALVTDVYALVDDIFTNVTFSNESGTSPKTIRNYCVYAEDIDSDGIVELPSLIPMEGVQSGAALNQYMVRWYATTASGGQVDKLYTYHNFLGGWYLQIDSRLASQITVSQHGNDFVFYLMDEDQQNTEKLMTISVLSGQNRQTQSTSQGRFPIYATESVIYAASLETAADQYEISQENLIKMFHLIRQDWNTGET